MKLEKAAPLLCLVYEQVELLIQGSLSGRVG